MTTQGWVHAADLTVGSQVLTSTNETATVTSVRAWTSLERAYNLTVENTHTYLISDSHLWVHNDNGCTPPSHMKRQVDKGLAPATVKRVDSNRAEGLGKSLKDGHVHFDGGAALYSDGTWKHGSKVLTNKEKKWLTKNGWKLPNE